MILRDDNNARPRILLADSDKATQTQVKEILSIRYDVITANDGVAALEIINNSRPNLVLCAIKLPKLSGTNLLKAIRDNAETCNLPLLLLSDLDDVDLRVEGLNAGVICIIKPFTETELLGRVDAQMIISGLEQKGIERERGLIKEIKNQLEQRIEAEIALQEANKRKDEFLATLAHELRNPLAPIRNALNIFKPSSSPARLNEAINLIDRQLQQMVRLIDDLLDASRITLSKIELKKDYISLREVIDNALEISMPLINDNRHEIELSLPDNDIYLHADKIRIIQIIANLLNNAAKYTDIGGKIELSAQLQNSTVTINIKDNGIGIPAEKMPHIFEMFAQVDTSLERSKGGLGIGLTLAKNLIQMHEGTITATSNGVNKGSVFSVTLPTAILPENFKTDEVAETELLSGLKILVVDDNEASAKTMGWSMEFLGYDVMLAHNGVAAITIASSYKPDVVLLDIGLPGMNGYDVCRKMKELPELHSTIFIAQTGWGEEKHKKLSREAGFDHHLVKPVDLEALKLVLSLEKISKIA